MFSTALVVGVIVATQTMIEDVLVTGPFDPSTTSKMVEVMGEAAIPVGEFAYVFRELFADCDGPLRKEVIKLEACPRDSAETTAPAVWEVVERGMVDDMLVAGSELVVEVVVGTVWMGTTTATGTLLVVEVLVVRGVAVVAAGVEVLVEVELGVELGVVLVLVLIVVAIGIVEDEDDEDDNDDDDDDEEEEEEEADEEEEEVVLSGALVIEVVVIGTEVGIAVVEGSSVGTVEFPSCLLPTTFCTDC